MALKKKWLANWNELFVTKCVRWFQSLGAVKNRVSTVARVMEKGYGPLLASGGRVRVKVRQGVSYRSYRGS